MSGGEDPGTIAGRLPPAPAPTGDSGRPPSLLDDAWGIIANAGGGDWTTQSEEWQGAAERFRDAYHAALAKGETTPATMADVQAVAESLELVYVPEQHRLHAGPKEQCNVDDSMTKTKIPESRLGRVSPDVKLCEHCIEPRERRLIALALQRP